MLEHVGKLLAEPQTNMLVFYNLSLGCTAVLSRMTTVIGSSIGFILAALVKRYLTKDNHCLIQLEKTTTKTRK